MPYLEEAITEFEYLVVWKKAAGGDEDIPEPKAGLDDNFDGANKIVEQCKKNLDEYLAHVKQQLMQANSGGTTKQSKIFN